jgi:peroxiredoxin (alkyl hydroperoxide reductase subunit C)
MMVMQIGQKAPEFTAQAYANGEITNVTLTDYTQAGKWVVLFFYPLDFTFVCPTEIRGFEAMLKEFEAANVQVLGASVDSVYSHKAWSEGDLGKLSFPLVSDLSHRISRDFGVLNEEKGLSYRGVFIIDPNGVVRSILINDLSVGRNVEEILRTVQAFQTGANCPVNWKPGQATL